MPFVTALVPEVDLDARRVVVADRPGLVSPFPDELGPDERGPDEDGDG